MEDTVVMTMKIALMMNLLLFPMTVAAGPLISFKNDVYPILQNYCASCHSPNGIGYEKSGFSVRNYASVMKGTKYGAVVVSGSSLTSNLIWLIGHHADASIAMPKTCTQESKDSHVCLQASKSAHWLPKPEVRLIEDWVNQGAKDN
ncbi:hypothetical protein U879_08805 [Defluviimonas sp. 20V17]|nr:hypothetical protein U879_08805 [Defluviimonas sp. 20V17]